ncbi:metallophosphoesterase [Paenibacillus sp. LMG 31456]|uniref:Metallophosphoesterase n=1 Tax=Paenibacillus foliorum TaxID=2654974 RepID=A0A972JZM5_9BACL|nr:metallophosphoesterase [Paenibacillus foliorum]NOU92003.1 metallophosphoesterase [Paenibacillus foliorum]
MTGSRMNRRAFLKKCAYTLAGIVLAPFSGYGYARYAEPGWLQTRMVNLSLKRLPAAFDGIRVIQFSDVHLGFHYSVKQLAHLVGVIQNLKPDLICFTGDLFDSTVSDAGSIQQQLTLLKAPLGKAAVLGNHDYYAKESDKISGILSNSGFELLTNRSIPIKRDRFRIWLSGVDDMWDGRPDLRKALQQVPKDEFTLLLSHCPDFADIALQHPIDLQLSGHTHGGQVRLPFYGHVVTPEFGQKYVDGLYTLGDGKLQVYTNRGIGVSVMPIRFWCRPELTVFTLHKG